MLVDLFGKSFASSPGALGCFVVEQSPCEELMLFIDVPCFSARSVRSSCDF